MSFLTGTNMELIYASVASGTAKASFTTEVPINDTAGMGPIPSLPKNFWLPGQGASKGIKIVARGILSVTATPTYTFTVRLGAAASVTAAILLGSAAMACASGVTNKGWEFEGDFIMRALGAAGANSTGIGQGIIASPAGFSTPFAGDLFGAGAQPGTVATVDTSIDNFINFNVACSASSASNSIQLTQLLVYGLN